jgi:hypothetical protein
MFSLSSPIAPGVDHPLPGFLIPSFHFVCGGSYVITMDLDPRDLERGLNRLARDQVPFAAMLTINEIGSDVLAGVEREIAHSFDRPTRWTQKAFYLKRATKRNLSAVIQRKTMVGRRFYLDVQAEGGTRKQTGLERALAQKAGGATKVKTVTPASGARLNKHGNLSVALVRRVMSGTSSKSSQRQQFFVPKAGHRLKPGVYARGGKKLKKILHISDRSARYRKRLNIQLPAENIVVHRFSPRFSANLTRAVATARV